VFILFLIVLNAKGDHMHPLITLLFDVTANGGWNLTAIMVYTVLIGLAGLAVYESRI
jgi:hypothetical protein